jgi:hypothetical protein
MMTLEIDPIVVVIVLAAIYLFFYFVIIPLVKMVIRIICRFFQHKSIMKNEGT